MPCSLRFAKPYPVISITIFIDLRVAFFNIISIRYDSIVNAYINEHYSYFISIISYVNSNCIWIVTYPYYAWITIAIRYREHAEHNEELLWDCTASSNTVFRHIKTILITDNCLSCSSELHNNRIVILYPGGTTKRLENFELKRNSKQFIGPAVREGSELKKTLNAKKQRNRSTMCDRQQCRLKLSLILI